MPRRKITRKAQPPPTTPGDNREYVIQSYIVCIMDLLGQSQRLKGLETLPSNGRPTSQMIKAFGETVGAVRRFREMFEGFFDQFKKISLTDEELGRLAPEQHEQFLRIREAVRTTQQFSDTFVFYAPVDNSFGDRTGAALNSMLGAAALGLLVGLAGGIPCRGGITVGTGTEIDAGNFYGPALVMAYEMESEIAEYPRVVLSQEAVELARRKTGFSGDAEIERLLVKHHQSPPRLLCTDSDGVTIVDFMGGEFQSIVSAMPEFAGMASQAYRFARSEAARCEAEGRYKLAKRYFRLLDYMEPRLSLWGIAKEGSDLGSGVAGDYSG